MSKNEKKISRRDTDDRADSPFGRFCAQKFVDDSLFGEKHLKKCNQKTNCDNI